ncbi:MAG: hypothetical protein R6V10_13270 [bacterium]
MQTGFLSTLAGCTGSLSQQQVVDLAGSSIAEVWWRLGSGATGDVSMDIEASFITSGGTVLTDTATVKAEAVLQARLNWLHHVQEGETEFIDVDVSGGLTLSRMG